MLPKYVAGFGLQHFILNFVTFVGPIANWQLLAAVVD